MDSIHIDIEKEVDTRHKVHIRIQSRTSKKSITTITDLDTQLNFKKILKYLKKNLNCNGAVIYDKKYGHVIKLQGDHRELSKQFLIDTNICIDKQIIVHGY
jgi:translation initiation factor 1